MHRVALRARPYRPVALLAAVALLAVTGIAVFTEDANAAITNPFTSRFSANTNGAIELRGNTVMQCPAATTNCTAGQQGVDNGGDTLNNNGYNMEYINTDSDATTFNHSSATISMPTGSNVLFAGLYWSGNLTAGTNGAAALTAADNNKVLFATPATGSWTTLTADTLYSDSTINSYQGFKDVTTLVSGAGNGSYTVANVQAGTGVDRYAGWSLVIAYHNDNLSVRSLRVYDGFGVVNTTTSSVDIPISGFKTPSNGQDNAKIGAVVYEGDLGRTGDQLKLDGVAMSDALNPVTNFFNSTVSENGVAITDRTPSYPNLMGVDADQFDASGKLAAGATMATLTLSTGGEVFYPGVVTFTTDVIAPRLVATTTPTDLNGGDLVPGDIVEYSILVRNTGDDTADSTLLTDAIPSNTTYVPGTLTIDGNTKTDASDTDEANFGSARTTFDLGTLTPSPATGSSKTVTFRVKIDTATPAGTSIVNVANMSSNGNSTSVSVTSTGDTSTLTVQQPDADLRADVAVAPTVVQRAAGTSTISYTVTVDNIGPELEPAPRAVLTLPTGVTAGTLPSGCTAAGQVITCTLADLAPTTQTTVTIPATAGNTASATATATVTASGSGSDPDSSNNTASAGLRVNTAPQPVGDTATTPHDTPVDIDVLANDTDADNQQSDLTVTAATAPSHGTVVVNADYTITYTPTPSSWRGADTFSYTVSDGEGGSTSGTVTVTTQNAPPVAADDTVATAANTPITIDVVANDTDPNNDARTVNAVTQPQSGAGAVTINSGTNRVVYTPSSTFKGTAVFTYTIADGAGGTDTATVRVTVANATPVAAGDTATVAYGGTATIDVLANDTDANGDTLSISAVGTPNHGTASISNGKILYTPPSGYSGAATFTYTITDGTNTATGTVTVNIGNAPPVAVDKTPATPYGTPVTLDPAGDSTDPNGDTLTVTGTTTPAHGTVVRNSNGTITYTPDTGFSGTDSFTYTISDGKGGTDTGTVTVTVANGVPTAGDIAVTVSTNAPETITVPATDPNGDTLTITIDTPPTHGTATVVNGKIVYTPRDGFIGKDTFHYTVTDGKGGSAGGDGEVTVVNSAPTAQPDAATTDTDTAVTVPVLANDTDPNGDTLTLSASTTPAYGTAVRNADGSITYTPKSGFSGTDTFTYTAADGHGLSDTGTVTITVNNAPPIAVDDTYPITPGETKILPVLANDTDPNKDPNTGVQQTLTVLSVTTPAKGTATLDNGEVTYTAAADATGSDTFSYTVSDSAGGQDQATVTMVIDGAPIATADTATTETGKPVTIDVLGNDTDPEGDALTVASVSQPAHGTATINAGKTVTYTPAAKYRGDDTFTYVAQDTGGHTSTATINVTVKNAPPVAVADTAAVVHDEAVDISVLDNDTDANDDELSVTAVGTPGHGTAEITGKMVRYTPEAGFSGADTFTYEVSDSDGGTATGTVTVTVADDKPVAVDDTASTAYGKAVSIDVLENDVDPSGSLTLTEVGTPTKGNAVQDDQKVTYTPPTGFTGVATFEYTAGDANNNEVTATVTVTVNKPPAAPDKTVRAKPGTALTITMPTVDKNGKKITPTSIGEPDNGTAVLNADGTVTYTPNEGFRGTDSFTYEAVDDEGNVTQGTITVTVAGTNQPPVATDNTLTVTAGYAIVFNPAVDDTDPDGDDITITSVGKAEHGTAVLTTAGLVAYKPKDSFASGTDSFAYTISDGQGGTDSAEVTIEVTAADSLATTGQNIATMVTTGTVVLLFGGILYTIGVRGPALLPEGIREVFLGTGPGRHRNGGRHRR
ncbi:Ig-like domain-containing protein [Actinoplanes sp. NBRC 101535]|uniref:beta strand repeat-containing protein n=1 Tax=Actinoplanes sp. NBRC 101535 TaxID=3032196 RepID=UPI0024A4E0E9|nr:Ig-like domain-containing protein [Actinoplanes sp. NBRC 101535]GLY08035.1 hypothetical protein Acsp01_84140 [Actinoplanes sp. NBRC 101535]